MPTICSLCGSTLYTEEALCAFHAAGAWDDDWAAGNKIWCDFIHRGIVLPRVASSDREPEQTISGWGMF